VNIRIAKIALSLASLVICASCNSETHDDARGLTAMVSVEGSNTMGKLMQRLAKAYMEKHPNVPVSLTSDDSGSGIAALINKTTDLATASRDLSQEEMKLLSTRREHLRKITIAGDAVVVLVNPANPVSELTLKQLHDIFTGSLKNWRELGGANKAIHIFSREKQSGTYSYFQQHVMDGEAYGASATMFPSTEAITAAIEDDPYSIGYEGLSNASAAASKVKMLRLKVTGNGPAVAPTVASEVLDYPLSRPLIIFVDHRPKQSVRQFLDFCTSDDGQKIVTAEGYARLK
jgi:phosphate transport system substrate-binding protein